MKAVVVDEFGPPEKFHFKEVPIPTPGPEDILVEVHAAGISFVDVLVAQGLYQIKPPLPFIPGAEFSGTIHAVGSNVKRFKEGDRVMAAAMGGAYAEFACVPSVAATPMPDFMSFADGSVFRVSYTTAYYALVQRGGLKPKETVLVLGAGGAVGSAAVQVAAALGARVIGSASSEAKRDLARKCGAVETIDTNAPDWRDQIKAMTDKKGVDIVVDPVGGEITERAFRSLAWKGRHLVIGYAAGSIPSLPVNLALLKGASLVGVDLRQFAALEPQSNRDNLEALLNLYAGQKIAPIIGKTYALADCGIALREVIDSVNPGRVIFERQ